MKVRNMVTHKRGSFNVEIAKEKSKNDIQKYIHTNIQIYIFIYNAYGKNLYLQVRQQPFGHLHRMLIWSVKTHLNSLLKIIFNIYNIYVYCVRVSVYVCL